MSRYPFRRAIRDGLAALVVGLVRYARRRWLPHACTLCGTVVAAGQAQQHATWHYSVAMAQWAAGGGRTRKPKRPPWMKPSRSAQPNADEEQRLTAIVRDPRSTASAATRWVRLKDPEEQ